ncbi:MAG: c-type cytochrome [Myxococcales bacterium]|nr:c-type cytochrome [Myxococcales bacterium]
MRTIRAVVVVVTWSVAVAGCGDDGKVAPDAAVHPDAPAIDAPAPLLTAPELAAAHALSPLPAPPADLTNAYADSAKAAALGQMLFFDKSYAGPLAVGDDGTNGGLGAVGETGKVSCASCHAVGSDGMDDRRSKPNNVSLGTDFGPRNALSVINSAFYTWTNWGGRFDSQWSLSLAVAENAKIMNSSRLAVAHLLYAKYRTEYDAAFPVALDVRLADTTTFAATGKPGQPAFDGLSTTDQAIINGIYVNYGKAIQAYMRTLISRDAAFDRFVAGDDGAISASAVHGFKLFLADGCVSCHAGPDFTDNQFHALAVPQTGLHVPASDLGRYTDVAALLTSPFNTSGVYSNNTTTGKLTGLVQDNAQKGQFRTKSLRNVALSAPYMHAGQHATLDEVITFYDQGGGDPGASGIVKDSRLAPLGLSTQDRADLVAFLQTLSGAPVAAGALVDTSK